MQQDNPPPPGSSYHMSSQQQTPSQQSPSSVATPPATASALDRGPLGLAQDEEQWVREKLEYALYDFEVVALAIKRYKQQLQQVPKDISRLEALKERHMRDPLEFLRQLKTKQFRYPESSKTLPVPLIDWDKYQYPPANPILPSTIVKPAFKSPISFPSSSRESSTNMLNAPARSRAASPVNEKSRIVRETARNLGIPPSVLQRPPPPAIQTYQPPSDVRIRTDGYGGGNDDEVRASPIVVDRSSTAMEDVTHDRIRSATPSAVAAADQGGQGYNAPWSNTAAGAFPRSSSQDAQQQQQTQQQQQQQQQHNDPSVLFSASLHPTGTIGAAGLPPPGVITNFSNLPDTNMTFNHMDGSFVTGSSHHGAAGGAGGAGASGGSGGVGHDKPKKEEPPRPPTYNMPWTDDEQKLLERLLEVYPDEPVAAQRFQKISQAMGTRTPKQVASRVQKYFIKLVKAGLEAPGRMNYSLEPTKPKPKAGSPKKQANPHKRDESGELKKKSNASRPRSTNKDKEKAPRKKAKSSLGSGQGRISGAQYLNYASAPTVYMSDDDDEESVQEMMGIRGSTAPMQGGSSSSSFSQAGPSNPRHVGYGCNSCGMSPIQGTRYHCLECDAHGGTNLCAACYSSGYYRNDHHLLSHSFRPVEIPEMVATYHYQSNSLSASLQGSPQPSIGSSSSQQR
ncbi:ZZ-type zinc finger-containing protein 3 [Actinomortierella ambigua]|nr:ZZ-type zinc finger-containing protein 3 [Actinomortierella ambigua]